MTYPFLATFLPSLPIGVRFFELGRRVRRSQFALCRLGIEIGFSKIPKPRRATSSWFAA
jgi:hypothetical protein